MGKKRTKKLRGKKTFGYGSKKKHRGGGSRGGRGMAGSFKHKKFKVLMENPNHHGKKGFKKKNIKPVRAINLKNLEIKAKKLGNKINLSELGYDKVLGTGKLTKPLEIEAAYFSENAKIKIEKIGGKAIQIGQKKIEKIKELVEEKVENHDQME